MIGPAEVHQQKNMRTYYAFQAKIYDRTRWSFLFGRNAILHDLPFDRDASLNILEVGCGTGYNLRRLHRRFPNAQLVGVDLSTDMLERAQKKTRSFSDQVQLVEGAYGEVELPFEPQLILFSYCLTMVNPHWIQLLRRAEKDVTTGGYVAVVDFHRSRYSWFRQHMKKHHVRMEAHILPFLNQHFFPVLSETSKAYFGVWEYFQYVGKKMN